jgi:FlaG/FlaF family flagellin (archaellin)
VKKLTRKDDAVSEIVGEMLLLTIVLVLLALFSTSLSNYLPPPRDPSVTIKMSPIDSGTVTLYHKGGDAIKKADLVVIVGDKKLIGENNDFRITSEQITDPLLFDLGDSVTLGVTTKVPQVNQGDEITIATTRAVLFKGTAREA